MFQGKRNRVGHGFILGSRDQSHAFQELEQCGALVLIKCWEESEVVVRRGRCMRVAVFQGHIGIWAEDGLMAVKRSSRVPSV